MSDRPDDLDARINEWIRSLRARIEAERALADALADGLIRLGNESPEAHALIERWEKARGR